MPPEHLKSRRQSVCAQEDKDLDRVWFGNILVVGFYSSPAADSALFRVMPLCHTVLPSKVNQPEV